MNQKTTMVIVAGIVMCVCIVSSSSVLGGFGMKDTVLELLGMSGSGSGSGSGGGTMVSTPSGDVYIQTPAPGCVHVYEDYAIETGKGPCATGKGSAKADMKSEEYGNVGNNAKIIMVGKGTRAYLCSSKKCQTYRYTGGFEELDDSPFLNNLDTVSATLSWK